MSMPTIPPFALYLSAFLLITNVITGVLWRSAAHEVQLTELRGEIAKQELKRITSEQQQITEDTTNGWKAALDATRTEYDRRLRNAGRSPMPGISGPAGGVNGLPADALALAAQCAETTLNYEALQRWVRQQKELK